MLILVAVVIIILVVAAALSLDIARIHVTRSELRTATDAAARAGAEALGRLQDRRAAIRAAQDVARQNLVAGEPLKLRDSDVLVGTHRQAADGSFVFRANERPFSAIRVTGERTRKSAGGSVPLLFGPIFGVSDFQPTQSATASRLDRDIALVLDTSGSMSEQNRFPALKNALKIFLQELEDQPQEAYVSLSIYNTKAKNLVPLTNDLDAIRRAFERESPDGRTAIGLGLIVGLDSLAKDSLRRPLAYREIILMTDGIHNTGISPLDVLDRALAENVTVHAITFSRDANKTLMQEVARRTGGVYLHAENNQELLEVFRTVANQMPVMLIE